MKIVVLAGGLSTERAVSLVTGASVCRALREGVLSEAYLDQYIDDVLAYLGDAVIAEMTCVGSLLIVALALNMLGITKIKVMNLVPACILPDLLSLIERAIGLSQENTITDTVRRSAMMFSLLDLLVPYAVPVSNFSDELKGTLDYIEENFCHDIRLDDLLRLAPCSKSSFFQKFYSMTGCSPIHYIENRKLEHAALLLISTKMTISEIASAVGFGDPLYFSKRFKHKYKAPPRIYREKVLTQDATL